MPKCKNCGHEFEQHASDIDHKDTQPCWHGACTGNGCVHNCKNYEPAEV